MKEKLFNKNFSMIVIGQLVSIFGNSALRFALPLYILDFTGSVGIFGTVLAISSIPVILFSPIGGILADRVNKRNIMVILDTITAIIIAGFGFFLEGDTVVMLIAVMMVLMLLIQSIYQPVVRACMPVVVHKDNLERANAVVSLINALSSMLAPVAAGLLYGYFGINTIIIVGAVCFGIAAFMEVFIKVKAVSQTEYESIGRMVKEDLKDSIRFITKDNSTLLNAMLIVAGINLFFTSMIIIGLPAMIKLELGLSSQLYGTMQGITAVGMIAGGILTGIIGRRINVKNMYMMLVMISILLLPISTAFMMDLSAMVTYWIISICCLIMMTAITIFSITMMSFAQRETPEHLIGKVMSYILVLTQCAMPIGQAIYGYIFDSFLQYTEFIVFAVAVVSFLIAMYSKIVFDNLRINPSDLQAVECER